MNGQMLFEKLAHMSAEERGKRTYWFVEAPQADDNYLKEVLSMLQVELTDEQLSKLKESILWSDLAITVSGYADRETTASYAEDVKRALDRQFKISYTNMIVNKLAGLGIKARFRVEQEV